MTLDTELEKLLIDKFGRINIYKSTYDSICCTCPECRKDNLFVSPSKACYNCFSCSLSGSLLIEGDYSFTKPTVNYKLQLEILNAFSESLKLYPDCKAVLQQKRGIYNPEKFGLRNINSNSLNKLLKITDFQNLQSAGLAYTNNSEGAPVLISNFFFKNILIPFYYLGEIVGYKTRLQMAISPKDQKYLCFPSFKASNYFYSPFSVPQDCLFITEGEFKCMSMLEHGYNTVSLHGLSYNSAIIFRLLEYSLSYKKIYLVLDSTKIPHSGVEELKVKLKSIFKQKLQVINLPLLGNLKMDCDSYLSLGYSLWDLI